MIDGCPAPEELARAVTEGAPTQVVAHVASCESCAREWSQASELRALARALPAETPAAERVLAVRASVVDRGAAVRRRARFRAASFAAFALAAGAVLAIGLSRTAEPRPAASSVRYHGAIVASAGARYSRPRAAPDELVVLETGRIHVEVSPLGPGERFRIQAPDGEVEVRGTAFDVTVQSGHLSAVAVDHGHVEVRSLTTSLAVLGAGESWRGRAEIAGAPTASVPVADSAATLTVPAPSTSTAPAALPAASVNAAPAARARRDTSPSRAATDTSSAPNAPATVTPLAPSPVPPERADIAVQSAPVPTPTPAPAIAPPKKPSPTNPAVSGPAPAASQDNRAREEDRRERRDERRERQDQRRLR